MEEVVAPYHIHMNHVVALLSSFFLIVIAYHEWEAEGPPIRLNTNLGNDTVIQAFHYGNSLAILRKSDLCVVETIVRPDQDTWQCQSIRSIFGDDQYPYMPQGAILYQDIILFWRVTADHYLDTVFTPFSMVPLSRPERLQIDDTVVSFHHFDKLQQVLIRCSSSLYVLTTTALHALVRGKQSIESYRIHLSPGTGDDVLSYHLACVERKTVLLALYHDGHYDLLRREAPNSQANGIFCNPLVPGDNREDILLSPFYSSEPLPQFTDFHVSPFGTHYSYHTVRAVYFRPVVRTDYGFGFTSPDAGHLSRWVGIFPLLVPNDCDNITIRSPLQPSKVVGVIPHASFADTLTCMTYLQVVPVMGSELHCTDKLLVQMHDAAGAMQLRIVSTPENLSYVDQMTCLPCHALPPFNYCDGETFGLCPQGWQCGEGRIIDVCGEGSQPSFVAAYAQCQPCAPGTYSRPTAAQGHVCDECPKGFVCWGSANEPHPCPRGTGPWTPQPGQQGQSHCTGCRDGYYSMSAPEFNGQIGHICVPCEAGSACMDGVITNCSSQCDRCFQPFDGQSRCVECPRDAAFHKESRTCTFCRPDSYYNGNSCVQCPPATTTTRCVQQQFANGDYFISYNRLVQCHQGYAVSGSGCVLLPNWRMLIVYTMIIIVITSITLVFILVWQIRKYRKKKEAMALLCAYVPE